MAVSRVIPFRLALARCMPSEINNAAKLQVKLSEFDSNLNMVNSPFIFYLLCTVLTCFDITIFLLVLSIFQNWKPSMPTILTKDVSQAMWYLLKHYLLK